CVRSETIRKVLKGEGLKAVVRKIIFYYYIFTGLYSIGRVETCTRPFNCSTVRLFVPRFVHLLHGSSICCTVRPSVARFVHLLHGSSMCRTVRSSAYNDDDH